MNITAIIITTIICATVAYISVHTNEGKEENEKKQRR